MTLEEFFMRAWEMLIGRTDGPLTLRLILQPAMAVFLALRAGLKDAREGQPPFFWSIFTRPARRRELLRQVWRDVGKVFVAALVVDVIYELIVYRWVYPGQALIVAVTLAILPYLILRGGVNRIARRLLGGAGKLRSKL